MARDKSNILHRRSDLEYDAKFWKETVGEFEHYCEWPGCPEGAEHKAPKSRDNLEETWWFCSAHAREYNRRWNYYEGMDEEAVQADMEDDHTWNRPTWNYGTNKGRPPGSRPFNVRDGFGFFRSDGSRREEGETEDDDFEANRRRYKGSSVEDQALAVLDLPPGADLNDIKARYKSLVKKHHPDANNGDKAAEERFKIINQAYTVLIKSDAFQD